jgi:phosphoadenosine phosphosulfate reductase
VKPTYSSKDFTAPIHQHHHKYKIMAIYTDKLNIAIDTLRRFNGSIPFDVFFSSGKDSIVMNKIFELADVNFHRIFYDIPLVHHSFREFVKENYPNTIFLKPKTPLKELCLLKKAMPTRIMRFCCEYMKEYYNSPLYSCLGVRKEESFSRKKRSFFELSYNYRFKFFQARINIIVNWSNVDIMTFINDYNILLPDWYLQYKRQGCLGCPMSYSRRKELLVDFPEYYNHWYYAGRHLFNNCPSIRKKFNSIENLMEWWLSDLSIDNYFLFKKQGSLEFTYSL